MFSMTKVELDLISDVDRCLFFNKGMRDGVFLIKHTAKQNNKYWTSYDSNKPTKYILQLDKNNFFGYAMSKFLPTCEFKWVDLK